MQKKHLLHFGLTPALLLILIGCGSSDKTTDDNTELSCTTSTLTTVTVPEITYTEVDETAEANDDEVDAQLISTNTRVTGSMNGYSSPSDGDYIDRYVINVSEGDEFTITLQGDGQNEPVNFNMYLNDGTSSNYNVSSENSAREEKIAFTVPTGMTQLKFFVDDYDGGGNYTLTVTTPPETTEITDVPTEECASNFKGRINNAVDGSIIAGVTVNLREGADTKTGAIAHTTTSDSEGKFSFNAISSKTYTVQIAASNFITSFYNEELPSNKTIDKTYSVSPTLAAGQKRIILNWGARPSDLDIYLNVPAASDPNIYKTVYYSRRSYEGSVMDTDQVNGYGPETITIETQNAGVYTLSVADFNFGTISASEAVVSIYDESGIIKQINVPTTGSGYTWNVFTLEGSTITEVNTIEVE